jgi:hypothetical protein
LNFICFAEAFARQAAKNPMTQAEKQKWEITRAKGQRRFIVVECILKRGVGLGAILALIPMLIGYLIDAFRLPM